MIWFRTDECFIQSDSETRSDSTTTSSTSCVCVCVFVPGHDAVASRKYTLSIIEAVGLN